MDLKGATYRMSSAKEFDARGEGFYALVDLTAAMFVFEALPESCAAEGNHCRFPLWENACRRSPRHVGAFRGLRHVVICTGFLPFWQP